MEFAREPGALDCTSTLSKSSNQIDVVYSRAYLSHQFLQEAQFFFEIACKFGIKSKEAARPFAAKLDSDSGQRLKLLQFAQPMERG